MSLEEPLFNPFDETPDEKDPWYIGWWGWAFLFVVGVILALLVT